MIMSRWTRLLGVAWLLLILTTGCSTDASTPDAAAATVRAFLQARAAGDAGQVYAELTTRAQEAMDRTMVKRYLDQTKATFGDVGDPVLAEPGIVRVPVRDMVLTDEGRSVKSPEAWFTVLWEGEEWRVAWAEPLFHEAAQAYQNDLLIEELTLAESIIAVDRFHYRGYLELHFAYRELKRYREAEVAIINALNHATPTELADVHDALARFKLLLNAPAEGLANARRALDLATPFTPDTYSKKWRADTLVVAGRAALAAGDRRAAEAYAAEAALLDPDSVSLAVFRQALAAQPGPPPRS